MGRHISIVLVLGWAAGPVGAQCELPDVAPLPLGIRPLRSIHFGSDVALQGDVLVFDDSGPSPVVVSVSEVAPLLIEP